ncbi:chromate efflux transporter [Brevibacterium sp. UCMA 11754]|uniref:chromate efflux transporter n=1 Tax=Brevibacterium sp. UCMA 11754 TaxID=2749198 RepID=UPI001F2D5285|nr:chromate efflux transporter [Brevibacterium sp. UCMA 11754]MCF2571716.1 chromate efflux transporter [Brevibacterium sp. UCMA 11754]
MSEAMADVADERKHPGTIGEVFWAFLRLGVTSFGGPVAHLGFFRETFVARRKWFSDGAYADLVALCQFLPGPASSQVGMAIGLQRAGIGGLLAAWFAFTIPSAIVLVAFALGIAAFSGDASMGWLSGLKAAAVAVVAQAVLVMAKNLTPDAKRATVAGAAMIIILLIPSPFVQVAAIVLGGVVGLAWLRRETAPDEAAPDSAAPVGAARDDAAREGAVESSGTGGQPARGGVQPDFGVRISRKVGVVALITFVLLLVALPILSAVTSDPSLRLVDVFYRAGALVFGGGHVVLPLLETETVATGLVGHDSFLAGYGAAQAVPGPLFTFAAFLGASATTGPTGLIGAGIALLAIFLPAALLVIAALPFWARLRRAQAVRRALLGVNAAVVGILAAALYDPVFTQGITSPATLALAVGVFIAQVKWKLPAWAAVIAAGLIGFAFL